MAHAAQEPVSAIAPPSPAVFLERYVRTGRPVAMKGLVADWPAVRRWTPEFLADVVASRMGDTQVAYRSTPAAMPRLDLRLVERGRMSLLDLLRECARSPEEGEELYVPGLDIPPGVPFAREIGTPGVCAPLGVYATTVFFGRNTKCLGHFHPKTQALLCQVQGVKRVRMYAPSELKWLSLFPPWSPGFFRSEVNFHGDQSEFPLASRARALEFELHPGDALFIPLHWLHVPEGRGWSVSVTHWWRPRPREWPLSAVTARVALGIGCEAARRLVRRTSRRLRPAHD